MATYKLLVSTVERGRLKVERDGPGVREMPRPLNLSGPEGLVLPIVLNGPNDLIRWKADLIEVGYTIN